MSYSGELLQVYSLKLHLLVSGIDFLFVCLFSNKLFNRNHINLSNCFMKNWYSSSRNTNQDLPVTSYTSLTILDLQPHSPRHALELECTAHFIHPFLITSIHVFFLLHISFKQPYIQSHHLHLLMHHNVFEYY